MELREPTEMELRVAAVLQEHKALEPQHSDYFAAARAAMLAMRHLPTDVIRDALLFSDVNTEQAVAVWEAIHQAASPGVEK